MKPVLKGGLIAAGYAAAILVGAAAVGIRVANTNGPDAQASGGMFAFGDAVVFVAVFSLGVAATGVSAPILHAIRRRGAPPRLMRPER